MVTDNINETALSVRLDPDAAGQWCVGCNEVQAEYQPEIFLHSHEGHLFFCKLCAWDHAPWLVSIVNMGHYNDWASWGGAPPTPQRLVELDLTIADMLGEPTIMQARPLLAPNKNTAMMKANIGEATSLELERSVSEGVKRALAADNRRVRIRYEMSIPVQMNVSGASPRSRLLCTTTRDLSDSGAYLFTEHAQGLSADVGLELLFPAGGVLLAKGHIVRYDALGVGVHFHRTQWSHATLPPRR